MPYSYPGQYSRSSAWTPFGLKVQFPDGTCWSVGCAEPAYRPYFAQEDQQFRVSFRAFSYGFGGDCHVPFDYTLNDAEIKDVTSTFELFDQDNDGYINGDEALAIEEVMDYDIIPESDYETSINKARWLELMNTKLPQVFNDFDADGNGMVSADELEYGYLKRFPEEAWTEEKHAQRCKDVDCSRLYFTDFIKVFMPSSDFDGDGDGKISPDEIEEAMVLLPEEVVIKEAFAQLDLDKDGAISVDELQKGYDQHPSLVLLYDADGSVSIDFREFDKYIREILGLKYEEPFDLQEAPTRRLLD